MKIRGWCWISPCEFGTLLFDLQSDPQQEHPIRDPQVERRMIAHLMWLMQENDAPLEQYQRLGLPAKAL